MNCLTGKTAGLFGDKKPETKNQEFFFIAAKAAEAARRIITDLAPYCARIQLVGSLRRRRSTVHDIDIVLESRTETRKHPQDLFKNITIELARERVGHWNCGGHWLVEKEGPRLIRFKDVTSQIGVDLYFAHTVTVFDSGVARRVSTWPALELIRTGSKEHNIRVMQHARAKGFQFKDALLIDARGRAVDAATERDLFAAIGMDYVEPDAREVRPDDPGLHRNETAESAEGVEG